MGIGFLRGLTLNNIISNLISLMPWVIRMIIYNKFGYTEKAFHDSDTEIRLEAYESLGYTKKAFSDEDAFIRENAYEELGYTKQAFLDASRSIRYKAFRKLGFTKEAMYDSDFFIQYNAFLSLGFISEEFEILDSGHNYIELFSSFHSSRKEYFKNCQQVLGCGEIKYKFTEEETSLLRMNKIPVNDLAILNDEVIYDKIN